MERLMEAGSSAAQCGAVDCGAPSKLNCPVRVPTTPLTLTAVPTAAEPTYACGTHATAVADVQALLPHASAVISEAVAVGPAVPKLNPLIVTAPPPLGAPFASVVLTTGAANDHARQHAASGARGGDAPSKMKPRLPVLVLTLIHTSRPAPAEAGRESAQGGSRDGRRTACEDRRRRGANELRRRRPRRRRTRLARYVRRRALVGGAEVRAEDG